MAINFPTSLDSLSNPTASDYLNSPSHAGQHGNANDILEALEAKVGINSSAVTSSLDYRVATLESLVATIKSDLNPIGTIYSNYSNSTNPGTLFGFGTWVAIAGRVIVGLDAGQAEFDTAGETGGAKTHTLTGAESGEKGHNHTQDSHGHVLNSHQGSSSWTNGLVDSRDASGTARSDGGSSISGTVATNQAVAASNAASAHNNLQPYVVAYMWRRSA